MLPEQHFVKGTNDPGNYLLGDATSVISTEE